VAALREEPRSPAPAAPPHKTAAEAAREYIERSKQKSRRIYLGYRVAVNLFVGSCKKTYFDQISRDDMLDFLYELRTRPSREAGRRPIGESTVFNYFLKTDRPRKHSERERNLILSNNGCIILHIWSRS